MKLHNTKPDCKNQSKCSIKKIEKDDVLFDEALMANSSDIIAVRRREVSV